MQELLQEVHMKQITTFHMFLYFIYQFYLHCKIEEHKFK